MNVGYQYRYVSSLIKRYGLYGLFMKTMERAGSPMLDYSKVYHRYLPTMQQLETQRKATFAFSPKISIVVPAFETPALFLEDLIYSVKGQSYPNWELCIADGSKSNQVRQQMQKHLLMDARIRYQQLEHNGGISENTNAGFAMATGEYIAMMDHDDVLSMNALYEMVHCLNTQYTKEERNMACIYSDEDKISFDYATYSRPHFKPDFNLEFLRRNNYFCHFLLFSKELLQETKGLRKEYDGAQDYDFVLRLVEASAKIKHVPKILYHWRIHEGSTAGNSSDKSYAFDNGCRAIEGHLQRMGQPGRARNTSNLGVYQVQYDLEGDYQVTIVSNQKEQLQALKKRYGSCYTLEQSSNKEKKNKAKIYLTYQELTDFSLDTLSKLKGEYILQIKDAFVDLKKEDPLVDLLSLAQFPENQIVAAKLTGKGKKTLSCGLTYTSTGEIIPLNGGIPAIYKGYFLHNTIPKNVTMASLNCAMLRKELCIQMSDDKASMNEDEMNFSGIYVDADYCLAAKKAKAFVIVTPEVNAKVRSASSTRIEDAKAFVFKWKDILEQPDPAYNQNLSKAKGATYTMKEPEEMKKEMQNRGKKHKKNKQEGSLE